MRWQMQYKAPFCTVRVREEMDFVSMLFTEADETLTNVLTQVQTKFSRWRDRPTVPTAPSQADENSPAGRPAVQLKKLESRSFPDNIRVSRLITARNGVRTDSQMLRTTFATSDHELYSRYAPEWFSSPILEVFRFQFRAGIRVEEKINIQVEMRDLQCQCRDSFPGAAG